GCRDFQVHRAQPKSLGAKFVESLGSRFVEENDLELVIELEQLGQLPIADHLTNRLFFSGNHGQPAAHPFLDGDNGHANDLGLRNGGQSIDETAATFAFGILQKGGVVRIDEDHSGASSPRRAASRSASRIRWHSSSTARINSLSRNIPTTLRQSLGE